ncbi:MAG: hypothetical protein ACI9UN_003166 [Granulosicoccus sp.]|jgi:hypothetical protein
MKKFVLLRAGIIEIGWASGLEPSTAGITIRRSTPSQRAYDEFLAINPVPISIT